VFSVSLALFKAIDAVMGLRVSEEEEIHGLDVHEHGMWGYPEQFIGDLPSQIAAHYPPPGTVKRATKHTIGREEKLGAETV